MSLRDLTGRLVRTLLRAVRTPRHVARPSAPVHLDDRAPTTDYPVWDLGLPDLEYAPRRDGAADPGDVVWARVPYEDDPAQGKDRPVLILARSDGRLIGLMLTSKDHDHDAADRGPLGQVPDGCRGRGLGPAAPAERGAPGPGPEPRSTDHRGGS